VSGFVTEALGLDRCHDPGKRRHTRRTSDWTVAQAVTTADDLMTTNRDESDCFYVSGLKTNGSARKDVKTHAEGCLAVEFEERIRFEKRIVRPDLNRTVSHVGHSKSNGRPSCIYLYFSWVRENSANFISAMCFGISGKKGGEGRHRKKRSVKRKC
jgi:hypothetical protein